MIFEQSFYTRGNALINESGTGLGIAAASSLQKSFLDGCMAIGSKFNTERSDITAEFVMYSEEFQSFVAVGVSPATNADGGVVNKLCHIFVPDEEERKMKRGLIPENYYLNYPFKKSVEKGSNPGTVALEPVLRIENYMDILEKYKFDTEKMASFLFKIFQILFNEKNLLLIVADESEYTREEHAVIARELTWLASCLVPGVGDEADRYRKKLSYGVYSKENISVINLAFSSDENLHTNRLYLGKSPDMEIPEVFYCLAEKALESRDAYREMVSEIRNGKNERRLDSKTLLMLYLMWKLKSGEDISQKDIPFSMDYLMKNAASDDGYRNLFIGCITHLDTVSLRDVIKIWNNFAEPEIKAGKVRTDHNIREAVKRLRFLFRQHLRALSLEQLSNMVLKNLSHAFKEDWCKAVIERLREANISDKMWEHLVCQAEIIEYAGAGGHPNPIELFYKLIHRDDVSPDNLEDMAILLYEAKQYLGIGIPEVKMLEEEYMSEKKAEDYQIEMTYKKIMEFEHERQQKQQEIERLKKEIRELNGELDIHKNIYVRLKNKKKRSENARLYGRTGDGCDVRKKAEMPKKAEKSKSEVTIVKFQRYSYNSHPEYYD